MILTLSSFPGACLSTLVHLITILYSPLPIITLLSADSKKKKHLQYSNRTVLFEHFQLRSHPIFKSTKKVPTVPLPPIDNLTSNPITLTLSLHSITCLPLNPTMNPPLSSPQLLHPIRLANPNLTPSGWCLYSSSWLSPWA